MQARSDNSRFAVEALEGRNMMSTVGYGDFNHDGREDMAVLTNPTTITVSLAKAGGGYTVSAILAVPKNRPASDIYVGDFNSDGKVDINAVGGTNSGGWVTHHFYGKGDGTFEARTTDTYRFKPRFFDNF